MNLCSFRTSESIFQDNIATEKGGAIYYDYARPTLDNSITFTNNSAQYGSNVASYAVKITFMNDSNSQLTIKDFGSGIAYPETLKFAVRDYDNQVMNLENQNQILMSAVNSDTTEVKGFNSAPLRNGIAEFENLIIVAEPGTEGIQVTATSNAINQNRIKQIFGSLISPDIISSNTRLCQPGSMWKVILE